jgi:hypothetical protein
MSAPQEEHVGKFIKDDFDGFLATIFICSINKDGIIFSFRERTLFMFLYFCLYYKLI